METKPLRPWIITIIVAFFAYIAYIVCGSAIQTLAKSTNIALGTIQKGYQAGNLLIYSILLVGWLISGLRVWQNDKGNKTAQCGGFILVCYGIICLVWQALALIGLFMQKNLVPTPLFITLTVVTAVLICLAMILLAIYYGHKTMLWLAISFAALCVICTSLHICLVTGTFTTTLNVTYSFIASIAEILQIVYLFKWAKQVKKS